MVRLLAALVLVAGAALASAFLDLSFVLPIFAALAVGIYMTRMVGRIGGPNDPARRSEASGRPPERMSSRPRDWV